MFIVFTLVSPFMMYLKLSEKGPDEIDKALFETCTRKTGKIYFRFRVLRVLWRRRMKTSKDFSITLGFF